MEGVLAVLGISIACVVALFARAFSKRNGTF